MNQLTRFDTSSLSRALVGFDTLFNDIETRYANQVNNNYPPYNIIKHSDDDYEIQIAVSGFEESEVTVEIDQRQLIIKGKHDERGDHDQPQYLHRGLATRDFVRVFTLAEYMEVSEGCIKNGVLKINIKRVVPEALKPRLLQLRST